ncbi:hypothetical protein GCM10023168_22200 [Fodinibacter luteus]|uniref:Cytoplasmic protein n=1 Tax=Fodinibacter luteus TaxID=552064 RepID=A0ABP8KHL6_9MICO
MAFENDRVRVLRCHDRPGDQTRPHEHPDSVMITASTFDRRLRQNGQSVDVTLPAGEVRWLDSQVHSGENIGATDTVTFFIELKKPGPPKEPGQGTPGPSPEPAV